MRVPCFVIGAQDTAMYIITGHGLVFQGIFLWSSLKKSFFLRMRSIKMVNEVNFPLKKNG